MRLALFCPAFILLQFRVFARFPLPSYIRNASIQSQPYTNSTMPFSPRESQDPLT